jgi:archaellum component FlaD/FlaE
MSRFLASARTVKEEGGGVKSESVKMEVEMDMDFKIMDDDFVSNARQDRAVKPERVKLEVKSEDKDMVVIDDESSDSSADEADGEEDSEKSRTYRVPQNLNPLIDSARKHPTRVIESQSMKAVSPPKENYSYECSIPEEQAWRGLSKLQVEAIILVSFLRSIRLLFLLLAGFFSFFLVVFLVI